MSQFSLVGARPGERILPEPEGQEGGLGPGRVSQRAGVLRGDRPKIPLAIGCRPAGDLSGELR